MKVRVELQAYLDQYSPNGQDAFDYEVPDGARVKDLVVKLGMPEELASVIIVGNTNADPSHPLKEDDRVILIPPLAGGAVDTVDVGRYPASLANMPTKVAGVLLLATVVCIVAFLATLGNGPSRQTIDAEPISLEQSYQLIDSGQVLQISIRKTGEVGEYWLLLPGEGGGTEFKWEVNGLDVTIFGFRMRGGLPVLSDDGRSVGLTPRQLDDLLAHVKRFNATATTTIDVVDQRQ